MKHLFLLWMAMALIAATSFFSCFPKDGQRPDEIPDSTVYYSHLNRHTIPKEIAVARLQNLLDAMNDEVTRGVAEEIKTIDYDGIISAAIPSTRFAGEEDRGVYVVPFNEGGYSIVSADIRNADDIFSIITSGKISEQEVERQMSMAQRQIDYEDRLFNLEDYILQQKGIQIGAVEDDGCSPILGDVVYNDRWEHESGYTVWCDEPGDTTIYTMGYSEFDSNFYVATYRSFDDKIEREDGDTAICESEESALIAELCSPKQYADTVHSPMKITKLKATTDILQWPFYEVMRKLRNVTDEAQCELDAVDTSEKVSVEIHVATSYIDNKRILNYGVLQRNGFNVSYPLYNSTHAPAGCAVVAAAIVCMQQDVIPEEASSSITKWNELGLKREGNWRSDIGLEYVWTTEQKAIMSEILYFISKRMHAEYGSDGTDVRTRKYAPKFFERVFGHGAIYDYTENRIRNQVDRNAMNFVRGYDSGGFSKNGHCWAVPAYMKVTDKNSTRYFAYINTCYSNDASGWYTMNNRLGYRHRTQVVEYK